MNRRDFLQTSSSAAALLAGGSLASAAPASVKLDVKPKLKLAVKYDMIAAGKSVQDKLELVKKIGFEGVEINSPSKLDLDEANAAQKATGIKIHGVIDSVHWNATHALSHPDPAVREKGLKALLGAIADAKKVGADTVLLVPGVVREETFNGKKEKVTYEQCYERSQAEVKKALPAAEKANVKIAIEVVWNNFITKPEQLVQYVDDFKSPFVGAYFDCSNMVKYGVPSADWIRKLGKRMLKFDFKGYSKMKQWVDIGQGDEGWPDVVKALGEIGYNSWATSEVGGGGEEHLTKVYNQMKTVLEQ
jgi:L-ribulose-5-phosphate 3-epimerase